MKTDLEFFRRNSELLEAELAAMRRRAEEWESNFETLQRALVGETGASGITVAAALRKDAERWRLFVNTASLGFDGAPSWNAVIRLPVFDHTDQTITALVDSIAKSAK